MEYAKNIVAVKTFKESALVREARKNLGKLLAPYSKEIRLAIANAFDESLTVSLKDAIARSPVISGLNVELFLIKVKGIVNFGSTFELDLAKFGAKLNVDLAKNDEVVQYAMCPIEQKHMIPFFISDNNAEEKFEDIKGVCENVSIEDAIVCLVFHFGFKVAQANLVYNTFKGA